MFDAICDCLGLEDVDAGLVIFIDWQQAKVVSIKAKELCHILKGDAFLRSYKGTTSFAVGRMECSSFLLIYLPINIDVVDESNDVVERLVSAVVS